jgi:hypothetical protein
MAKFWSENLKRAYFRPWIYNIKTDLKELCVDEVNPVRNAAEQNAHVRTEMNLHVP